MKGCILQLLLNTIYETTIQQICILYTTMKHMQKDEFEFGLTIPQGWRGGDLPLEEENNPVKQYEFSKLISVTADSIGFDSIYAYDHLIPFYSDDRNKNIFECFILLSGLAAITKRIKIGQIVTCNSYRNPSLVAKMLSTLDIISNARVELGIGAGWYEQEYVPISSKRIKNQTTRRIAKHN